MHCAIIITVSGCALAITILSDICF